MILLPYGHERTTVRRLPWVTLGIMGVCLVAFFLSGRWRSMPEEDWAVQEHVLEAIEYYTEHSYLSLDPEFKQTFLGTASDEEMMDLFGALAELHQTKPRLDVIEAEQEHLDAITTRALEGFKGHTLRRWGLMPKGGNPHGWLTHMFLHAGWLHLIGNLLILFLAGPFVEDVWGRPLYLAFYIVSGLVAAFFHILSDPTSTVPMIGASGAIAGVMGAFLIRYGKTRIKFFYLFMLIRGTFMAPAWLMIPLWFVSQVWMGLLTSELDMQAGVAYWAHVGGFVVGVATAWVVKSKRIEERYIDTRIQDKITLRVEDNEAVVEALKLREGDPEQAFRMLTLAVMNDPKNHDGAAALWELARDLDRKSEAVALVVRSIGHQLRTADKELALDQWSEVLAAATEVRADPRLLVRVAQELAELRRDGEMLSTLQMAMLSAGDDLEPPLALTIARLAVDIDPETARTALQHVLARTDIDPDTRSRAEQLLGRLPPDLSSVPLAPGS